MVKRFYKDRSRRYFIDYQVFQSPYAGPRTKARHALRHVYTQPMKYVDFFYHLKHNYRQVFNFIEWVRFHRFKDGEMEYAVAIIYTRPDIAARQSLYDDREKLTNETGWYPLVTGSRSRVYLPKIDKESVASNKAKVESLDLESLLSIEEIQEDGTCFKIYFDKGNVIFDTGFDSCFCIDNQTKFVFISHFHQDHSGGLVNILSGSKSIPIILSLPTFNSLWHLIRVKHRNSDVLPV